MAARPSNSLELRRRVLISLARTSPFPIGIGIYFGWQDGRLLGALIGGLAMFALLIATGFFLFLLLRAHLFPD